MPGDNQTETQEEGAQGSEACFEYIEQGFPVLAASDVKQKLLQWNLDQSLQIHRFRVHRRITKESEQELIRSFFHDCSVQNRLGLSDTRSDGKTLGLQPLRVTITSLNFFQKLVDAGLVAESGALRRCLDEVYDGATASDLVKESFINPDSENANVFSEDEQQELIFRIFRGLVIGGSMCQSDESIVPYEQLTKLLYKALVSVKKNAADRATIDITSHVYEVDDPRVFDSHSPFSSCFVVLDAKKRWLTVWHNTFRPFW